MFLKAYKELVEKWMDNYFITKDCNRSTLLEPMRYSLKVGGKRIRPILMLCAYNLYKNDHEEVLPFAAAMEMIHTYSLIHDDLPCMDNDDLRRGKPTNHKVYGEALATLAGDSLLNEAMVIMFKECLTGDLNKIKAASVISTASGIDGMIKGQIIDIESEGQNISEADLLEMHKNKTGKLIEASVMAGAIIAGAEEKEINVLSEYGKKLGLAFQIKDDILDVEGDSQLLGKSQSDGENEKTTFVTMYGIEKCKGFCESLTKECYELLSSLKGDTTKLKEVTEFLLNRNF